VSSVATLPMLFLATVLADVFKRKAHRIMRAFLDAEDRLVREKADAIVRQAATIQGVPGG